MNVPYESNYLAPASPVNPDAWAPYVQRYRRGEWRDRIFHDLILGDARRLSGTPTLLDIGCGKGFDTDIPLQRSLVTAAGRYIGVEPDETVTPGSYIPEVHRCLLEEAPVAPASVDVCFAVMVLEHVPRPTRFWDKLHDVLKPGGVFWGFTVDARHWFSAVSLLMERLAVKDLYLNLMCGSRGRERYENYPVFYRCNRPAQVARYARRFQSCQCINFGRVGQLDPCLPRPLRPVFRWMDHLAQVRRRPGTLLAIRAVK